MATKNANTSTGVNLNLFVELSSTIKSGTNSSNVSVKIYIRHSSLNTVARSDPYFKLNGVNHPFSTPEKHYTNNNGTSGIVDWVIYQDTFNIEHNSDGKKTVDFEANWNFGGNYAGTYISALNVKGSMTLDAIPKASTITVPTSFTIGTAGTITIKKEVSTYTSTLRYEFGSKSGTIATKISDTTKSWTPPVDLASVIPNDVEGSGTIFIDTYDGTRLVGTNSASIKIKIPTTMTPTIKSVTVTRIDNGVPSSWGIYVKGKSKARIVVVAEGVQGSSISAYEIKQNSSVISSSSDTTTNVFTTSGKITFTIKVTDSRLKTATTTAEINVVDYNVPTITSVLSQRSDSAGNIRDDGTYIKANINFTFSSCSNKNTAMAKVYFKKRSVSSWSSGTAIQSGGFIVVGGGNIDINEYYDVKYEVTDSFGTITKYDTVSTQFVTVEMLKGGHGLGIGVVPTLTDTIEINQNWNMKVLGKSLIDLIHPVGSVFVTSQNINPSELFKGTSWTSIGSSMIVNGFYMTKTFYTWERTA